MKFMLFMIPQVYQSGEVADNFVPPVEMVEKMTRFNEELASAGVLLSLEGLHPPKKGARVSFVGGKPNLTEEIAAPGSVIGGFWMLDLASKNEAIAWARRVPAQDGDCIEVRQVFAMEDMGG
jgi:hypothetical protein